MTDKIFLHGLTVHANHGVGEDERRIGQQFMLDLTLDLDLDAAVASDKLADTISYADVADVATKAFRAQHHRLVEAAGGAVADAILAAFPRVERLTVTVHKPHAPIAAVFADVGVTLTRTRK
ncbi:putative dihydroneopterin aldolase [Variibacter gotjawalensis]|uniref:7,8-dihydroneopterin aldolase n=1 Tax=Variibacter gotjawalensis TaxID=1333996 RepID=A0A0S3PZA9_9BRAD|nr:dihydroneopterin aldolase [Variibacter gotjawalensis]NIK47117.1 dihydroneopterin aldolase [Variibacter gotjawalensis]RZS49019.1 dihydroneopterin aldolase [Variibacter gotjawalensis]BAT61279.1 putative dihydroneopterin aldolase [Variibacter gotjawalensis]